MNGRSAIRAVVVIVPAHDEQALLAAALDSIERAATHQDRVVSGVLVLDSCTDDTEEVGRSFVHATRAVNWTMAATTVRRASSARQHGLDVCLATIGGFAHDSVAVLSTDADTVVPVDWISTHVALLDSGLDAVAGVVELAPEARTDLDYDAWFAEYTSNFGLRGHHPHVHCANLSVRLDMLLHAGGFGHAHRAEDIDLWDRLARVPGARRSSNRVSVVETSHRRDGRVVGGFASALAQFQPPCEAVPAGEASPHGQAAHW